MKATATKAALFILLLLLLQLLVGNLLVEKGDAEDRAKIDAVLTSSARVMFFGDSVLTSTAPRDLDRRTLEAMIATQIPEVPIVFPTHPAHHLGIIRDAVNYLSVRPVCPRQAVIAINLRSFSPLWDRNPRWQFQELSMRLQYGDVLYYGLKNPATVFRLYDPNPISVKEFEQTPIFLNGRQITTVKGVLEPDPMLDYTARLRRMFTAMYMYRLTQTHRKLLALEQIIDRCRAEGISVMLYVTPIDVQSGELLLGPRFRKATDHNVAVLTATAEKWGIQVLDLSTLLASSSFDW